MHQIFAAPLLACSLVLAAVSQAHAFSDRDLAYGFNGTVFGSEFAGWGWQSRIVKKFTGPVRFHVDDRSGNRREAEALKFIRTLPRAIRGLDTAAVSRPEQANFRIFIVKRSAYNTVVRNEIYRQPSASFVPGKCLVRVVSSRNGISRSDAVIVGDEGDFLFRRCLIEETLQGLGPVNDNASLRNSVFNDQSRHATFTLHDRYILNMLYHPWVRPGMRKNEVETILPRVIGDVRVRLGRGS